ncbi:MAG: DUF58 domain-containing protein [Chloroflexota bacterium]|nr:DUF58 domain-containing protein [Chloroflexota bacterium]
MKRAIGLALLVGTVLYGALSSGFSLYFHLAYLLVGALAAGALWAFWNLRSLEARVERRTLNAQVDGLIEGHISVRNLSRIPKPWLEVQELGDMPGHASGRVVALGAQDSRAWMVRTICQQRGVFTLGPLQVTSSDPLGLFRFTRRFSKTTSVVVYPATLPLPYLRLPLSHLVGDESMRRRAQQMTPLAASVREYVHGDAVNRIHWPTTARMGKLMVKEFDLGLSMNLWILLDLEASVQAGQGPDSTEETAVTIAASVARKYSDMGLPVGLAAEGERSYLVASDSSPSHLHHVLEELARVRATGRTPLENTLGQVERHLGRYSTLLIITPSPRDDWLKALPDLRRRGVRVALVLLDRASFSDNGREPPPQTAAVQSGLPVFTVRRGQPLEDALRTYAAPGSVGLRSGAEVAWR